LNTVLNVGSNTSKSGSVEPLDCPPPDSPPDSLPPLSEPPPLSELPPPDYLNLK